MLTSLKNVSRSLLFLTTVALLLNLATVPPAVADGNASGGDNSAYVRIFSARVPDGPGKTLEELETIALASGTEEIAEFRRDLGPENKIDIWTIRPGSDEYAYPGYTLTLRTHLATQKSQGALTVSADGRSATEALRCWDEPVTYVFPQNDDAPLVCRISEDGRSRGTITVHEFPSPAGGQPWPTVIRMDDLFENESVVQVFEYLDGKPRGLPPLRKRPDLGPCDLEELAAKTGIDRPTLADQNWPQTQSIDFVEFKGKWGCGGYDLEWNWSNDWVTFEFDFVARALVQSEVNGYFTLVELDPDNGDLTVGAGQGYLGIGFELGLEAKFILGKIN